MMASATPSDRTAISLSRAFFVCHEGRKTLVQLPLGPAIHLEGLLRKELLGTAVNRGNVEGIKKRGDGILIPIGEFGGGDVPVALKDGDEYELVLSTSGMSLRSLLCLISRKAEGIQRDSPFFKESVTVLQKRLSVTFAWDTCHVEGNAFSLGETIALLELGEEPGSATGAAGSMSVVGDHLQNERTELFATRDTIADFFRSEPWHAFSAASSVLALLRSLHTSLKATEDGELGRWREVDISVGNTPFVFPVPEEVPSLMDEFSAWLASRINAIRALDSEEKATGTCMADVFTLACEAHIRFVNIHPFIDGNGRTARLLVSCIISEWGFPFFSVPGRAAAPYLEAIRNTQLRETGVFSVDLDGGRGCFTDFLRICAHFENEILDTYISVFAQANPTDMPRPPSLPCL